MDLAMFVNGDMGSLVPISGRDAYLGEWTHQAFVPGPLPREAPMLSGTTYMAVAEARASLAALTPPRVNFRTLSCCGTPLFSAKPRALQRSRERTHPWRRC